MADPVNKAFTWLESALLVELGIESCRSARQCLAEAEAQYSEMQKEIERLKSENASLKKQVDSLWVGRRHWDGDDS